MTSVMDFTRSDQRNLLILTLVAAALRLAIPGQSALSWDEAQRLLWSLDSSLTLREAAIGHVGAAGHVVMERALAAITREPWVLRLQAGVAGVLAVPLLYQISRRHFSKNISLIAAWLLCLSPLHLAYSRQAEEYAFAAFFGVLALGLALELARTREVSINLLSIAALTGVLGFLLGGSFLLPWWLALATGVLLFGGRELPPKTRVYLALSQVPLLIVVVWVSAPWGTQQGASSYFSEVVGTLVFDSIRFAPAGVLTDLIAQVGVWLWQGTPPMLLELASYALAALIIALCVLGHRRLRSQGGKQAALVAWSVAVAPMLLSLALWARFGEVSLFSRALLPVVPGLLLLVAAGVMAAPQWLRTIAAGSLGPLILVSSTAILLGNHPAHPHYFEQAVARLRAQAAKGEELYVHPGEAAGVFAAAAPDAAAHLQAVAQTGSFTLHAGGTLAHALTEQELARWPQWIAARGGCLLSLHPLLRWRDPSGKLAMALHESHGYEDAAIGPPVSISCPAAKATGD